MPPTPPPTRPARDRREQAEAWWAFIARVLAFILGAGILINEAGRAHSDLYLIVAGVGLCGPVVAQSVATVFAGIRGGQRANGG